MKLSRHSRLAVPPRTDLWDLVWIVGVLLSLASLPSLAEAQEPAEWTPKFVVEGLTADGRPRGLGAQPLGDVDGDGYTDAFLRGGEFEMPGEPPSYAPLWGILGGRGFDIRSMKRMPRKALGFHGRAIVRRDQVLEFIGDRSNFQEPRPAERFLLRTGEFLGEVPNPPPPPGFHFENPLDVMSMVGDIDGDGYDDVLGWNYAVRTDVDPNVLYFAFSLLDGRTLSIAWTAFFPHVSGGLNVNPWQMYPLGDANGDGVDDLAVTVYFADPDPRKAHVLLSGANGSQLWLRDDFPPPQTTLGTGVSFPDINSDGVREHIVYRNPLLLPYPEDGYLAMLSGSTGETIWKRDLASDWPWWPTQSHLVRVAMGAIPGSVGDTDEDGVPDIGIQVQERPLGGELTPKMWIYSGATGELLSRDSWPDPMAPWLPASTIIRRAVGDAVSLGDVDGDGWPEIGFMSITAGFPTQSRHLVVAGRQTLDLPKTASIGQELPAKLWVPAGAGLEFQLLASTEFKNDGSSFHVGDWDTHLGVDELLRQSATRPWTRGTLDSSGRASFDVRVPQDGRLRGKTLYSIVVVKDPSKPDGVLTLSTLTQTAIQ